MTTHRRSAPGPALTCDPAARTGAGLLGRRRSPWAQLGRSPPLRLALLEEGVHSFARVWKLARGSHHLDRVCISLGLVEICLRVQRLLSDSLALRGAARDALEQVRRGRVELLGRH